MIFMDIYVGCKIPDETRIWPAEYGGFVSKQAGIEGTKLRIGCRQAHSNKRLGSGNIKSRNGTDCQWGITVERGADGL